MHTLNLEAIGFSRMEIQLQPNISSSIRIPSALAAWRFSFNLPMAETESPLDRKSVVSEC